MAVKIAVTEKDMERVNTAIENAGERERKDDHLTDEEREQMVADFESVFGTKSFGYPVDGDITEKFIYIIYDWC